MKYFIIFLYTCFFICSFLFSSELSSLVFYTEYNVLSYGNVYCIAQDSRDRLYFATDSGLIRYDGISVYQYMHIPFDASTISSCHITTLYMEENDILWLGTQAGLDKLDITTGIIKHYPNARDAISSIFRDSKGRLWVGTLDGLNLCVNEETGVFVTFSAYDSARYLGNAVVCSISEDSKGRIFVSTYDGVWEYDELTISFKKTLIIPGGCLGSDTRVCSFIEDNGTYWAAAWDIGLVHIFPQTNTYTIYQIGHNHIYTLYNNFINNNYIAIGTWKNGFYIFNKQTNEMEHYTGSKQKHDLINNNIYSFFIDKYDIFYIGADGFVSIADINLVSKKIAIPIYPKKEQKLRSPTATQWISKNLTRTSDAVWSLCNNALVRYGLQDSKIVEFFLPSTGLSAASISTVYALTDTTLLVGTNEGLYQFDTIHGQFKPFAASNDVYIRSKQWHITALCRTKDNMLWIGTKCNGLICFNYNNNTTKMYALLNQSVLIPNSSVLFIKQDHNGYIWVGANKGLYCYDILHDGFISYSYHVDNPLGISANYVDSFCEDSNGVVWFGTDGGGIFKFDPVTDSFCTYTTADGLSSNRVIGIADAGNGYLWIATLQDLHLFDTKKETIQFYTITNTVQYTCFSCAPINIKEQKLLFLGTDNGIIQLSQDALENFSVEIVPVRVQSMRVRGKEINLYNKTDLFSFSRTKNDIEFYFSVPYSLSLKKIAYAYKLVGFDNDWIVTSDRKYATYSNLSAGSYTFLVKNSTDPDSASDSISFTIHPHFLVSSPMIVFYVIILLFIIFLIYKMNKLYLIQQYMQLLEQKQKDLMQDNVTLQELSMVDYLTNIGNRRYIDITSEQILQSAKEKKVSLSVMLIDVDFFKHYNDTYGHQAGDVVLQYIAATLKSRIRPKTDLIGRYGGEEFLIILYNITVEESLKIAEEMRISVENLYTRSRNSLQDTITISIGLFSDSAQQVNVFSDMIYKADCALYDAKNTGRNKVCIYEEENTSHSSWIINR